MPRDSTTGVFTRTSNSFSEPVYGTIIDPTAAIAYYNDIDLGLSDSIPEEPVVVTGATATVAPGTATIAIQRAAPATTGLTLPTVAGQNGIPLHVTDQSTSVTGHTITLTPNGTEKIMTQSSWQLISTASSLGNLTLYPSVTLSGWFLGD